MDIKIIERPVKIPYRSSKGEYKVEINRKCRFCGGNIFSVDIISKNIQSLRYPTNTGGIYVKTANIECRGIKSNKRDCSFSRSFSYECKCAELTDEIVINIINEFMERYSNILID